MRFRKHKILQHVLRDIFFVTNYGLSVSKYPEAKQIKEAFSVEHIFCKIKQYQIRSFISEWLYKPLIHFPLIPKSFRDKIMLDECYDYVYSSTVLSIPLLF